MKDFKFSIVATVLLFTTLALEGSSHYRDLEHYRALVVTKDKAIDDLHQAIFDQSKQIDELQKTLDSLHLFRK